MISAQTLVILILLIGGAVGIVIYAFSNQIKKLQKNEDKEEIILDWLKTMKDDMQGSVEKNSEVLERQLKEQREAMNKQTKMIWERLENSSKVMQQVHKELGGITEFGKDMKDLSNVLKSPKLRGGLGEQLLYEILKNNLPVELYKTQHKFKSGDVCDAVITLEDKLIPIDSKFPMENFKLMINEDNDDARMRAKREFAKDVEKRIDEISKKYILPEEGTTDYAIMYIPSENISYEIIVNTPQILEYAEQKRVICASPNYISYLLKIFFLGYQEKEFEKQAGKVLTEIKGVAMEAQKFGEDLGVLERHITHTYKAMDNIKIKFGRLFGKIESIQAIGGGEKEKQLEQTTETLL